MVIENLVKLNSVKVVALLVKERVFLVLLEGVTSVFVFLKIGVKDRWVSIIVRRHDDVGQSRPFLVRVRAHEHTRETISDIQRNVVTVECSNDLFTTNLACAVVNQVLIMFKLPTEVNELAFSHVSALMTDNDDVTLIGEYNTTGRNNEDIVHAVIVDAAHIDDTIRLAYNAHITAGNAAIGATINQGSFEWGVLAGRARTKDIDVVDEAMRVGPNLNFLLN